MDANASASATPEPDADSRRRSGRVVKVPAKYAPEPTNTAAPKRKRGAQDGEGVDDEEVDSDEDMSDEDDASDDEHPAPRSRKAGGRSKKPSSKKPKINGAQPSALAQVSRIPSRPKKTVRIEAGEKGTGLFADVFGSGDAPDRVAKQWLEKYKEDDASALADLINCILQCAGCDLGVTTDDIRDPENIPNRLVDLQTVYQEQQITDYPLISRAKSTKSFRDMLVGFFHSLIGLLHETDVLYKNTDLMDNLHAWLASMSSSSLRPFRHTATTISLAVQTGLVLIASVLDRRIANIEQQLAAAKKSRNKTKASEVQRSLNEANGYRKICSDGIQSFFDTVFVHRYRDVDPKIRAECVDALGAWIWDLPTVFMEPGYLRYLGWMLSDTNATTRQEVLKQLLKVFRRDAQQLGHFIDRFRPRLIEMATLDSEVFVRVTAISVIDTLRSAALLEPSEIDAIAKLIFDTEIRIRKAVVNFFVACIDDVYEGKLEEIGGADVLEELDDVEEDDYESPRKEWINIKCLAEMLAIYDAQIEGSHQNGVSSLDAATELLDVSNPDTRISLAAQVLYDKVPEVTRWEMISGYLLFDHTTSAKSKSRSKSKATSPEAAFKKAIAPSAEEESILLDVLSSAVKSSLTLTSDHDKGRRKLGRSEAAEAQEEVALELTTVIPKLLNKFGAEPETAAIVLRLERFLSLDTFQQLRQDSSKFERLLDEISTQFNRHDDKRVLSEATAALLHARQYEELEELTDSRLSLLWDNAIDALRNFDKSCELSVRGNLPLEPLRNLSTVLMKISKLASISDCVDALEAKSKSKDSSTSPAIDILSNIVHRGKYEPQEDEIDDLEDEVVTFAIKASQFYFMWKARSIAKLLAAGTSMSDAALDTLSVLRQSYRRHLIETFSSRAAIDQLRLFATGSLCDLHLTFATLRPAIKNFHPSSAAAAGRGDKLKVLLQDIEPGLVPELISIFDGAERQYAKKSKKDKLLNDPAEDEDPMADDEELDEDDEDEDLSKEERYAAELKAERAFCELTGKYVLALSAGLIEDRGSQATKLRRRILRNETKLGHNFKEIVAHLDEEKMARRHKKATKQPAKSDKQGLSLEVVDDDDDHVFDDVEPEEGSREDLRRKELLEDEPIDEGEDNEGGNNDADDDGLGD
ncbi:cohesin complex subunit [Metarhizium acridum]|uniref:cohesin complex subunit n=1 Tax=Metarhizium acridum TaxID=92637 RepID=UPI001C6AA67B|nr:cohesin complex subunit [Metarhizium acridum]KAG8421789.1 cohesin complex subunit [Metarhizium acridum]